MVHFIVINLCVTLNKLKSECFQFFGIYLPPLPSMVRYRLLKFEIHWINYVGKCEKGFGWRLFNIYLTPKKTVVKVGGFTKEQLANFYIFPILGNYLIFRREQLPTAKD